MARSLAKQTTSFAFEKNAFTAAAAGNFVLSHRRESGGEVFHLRHSQRRHCARNSRPIPEIDPKFSQERRARKRFPLPYTVSRLSLLAACCTGTFRVDAGCVPLEFEEEKRSARAEHPISYSGQWASLFKPEVMRVSACEDHAST